MTNDYTYSFILNLGTPKQYADFKLFLIH